ncbi:hypothetical protein M9458_057666 [Cirrhinus mrigala]|uniref:Uncharacterized protein n=1 Tax=Cirrhinus mrigala TaxID=683832 RepID=A0ABD0MDT6_CIRMR
MQRERLEEEDGGGKEMAGEQERGGQQKERGGQQKERKYGKGLTVAVEIVGESRITMMEMLTKIKEECGKVIACRYKTPKDYELTMEDEDGKEKLLDGLKIKESRILAKEVNNDELIVSFLGLPAYIEDGEILEKLQDWGVTAISQIKRRMWPGTDIADGTRFLKGKTMEGKAMDAEESVGQQGASDMERNGNVVVKGLKQMREKEKGMREKDISTKEVNWMKRKWGDIYTRDFGYGHWPEGYK